MSFSKNIALRPSDYVEAAFLAHEAGCELVSRLDLIKITPDLILDVGCGPAATSMALQEKYINSKVIAVDKSQAMLNHAKKTSAPIHLVCADANQLPLADKSVDLIFANFFLSWQADLKKLFQEWKRILRPQGLILFTALGIDTLKPLQNSVTDDLPYLYDMHDIGDELIRTGFTEPVLDVCNYTVTYRDYNKFIFELYASEILLNLPKNITLVTPNSKGIWEVNYEIIFAHAFLAEPKDHVVKIPLTQLRNRQRVS